MTLEYLDNITNISVELIAFFLLNLVGTLQTWVVNIRGIYFKDYIYDLFLSVNVIQMIICVGFCLLLSLFIFC